MTEETRTLRHEGEDLARPGATEQPLSDLVHGVQTIRCLLTVPRVADTRGRVTLSADLEAYCRLRRTLSGTMALPPTSSAS